MQAFLFGKIKNFIFSQPKRLWDKCVNNLKMLDIMVKMV
jgi:hypothetical protein